MENKNYIMAELKQSEMDNLEIIQNISKELEKYKNMCSKLEEMLKNKDQIKQNEMIDNDINQNLLIELEKYKNMCSRLEEKLNNKDQLKQSEMDNMDNIDIIQNLSIELEKFKNMCFRLEERLKKKDQEITHYKNIVIEMNSKNNSIDNSKVNSSVVSNNNAHEELIRLKNEASDREHLIQKLSDEITIMKNKLSNNHISISRPSLSTPKTSRIN